ncbi:MAG TPA: radical SAM protein [Gemmataceae bacterium]|jgi:radical SAM superfamily enzyme YgiQ (UPF0313 family)|nr:radical SAM protein [Gemmataceae bacterium]
MKLLLIQPRFPESFWSFTWAFHSIARDKRAAISPLGLATLAALTPPNWVVRVVDENVEPIPWDEPADVVGVCGMAVQYPRQIEICEQFRERGCHVVVGGPYASLCPEEYADVVDTVVAGEAEYTWPRFCVDFENGRPQALYRETGTVDLADSPVPRQELLKLSLYQSVAIQFSRGCPFRCEFCDIIVTFGRKPRAKTLPQMECELDLLRSLGIRNVFFIDDNLIGHLPRCRELLDFLNEYQRRHRYRFTFGAEVSANVASPPGLLEQLRRARFQWIFIGLETPSKEALRETLKEQNNRADPLATLNAVYAHGIDVYASFVVGFDADDATIFDRQREFIVRSGIVVASLGLLLALPRTPLFERLGREGRLKPTAGDQHQLWNNLIATNVVPLRMTEDEMLDGFRDLMACVASDEAIAERVRTKLRQFGRPPLTFGLSPFRISQYLARFVWRGVLPGGPRRWVLVARSLLPALRDPRLVPFAILNWTYGLAIQSFVREHLGRSEREPVEPVESACSIVECPTA